MQSQRITFPAWELGFPASTPKHRLALWVPPWGPKRRPTIWLSPHYMQNRSWAPEWNGQDSNRIGHNPFSRGHILRIELSDTGSQHGSPALFQQSSPTCNAFLRPIPALESPHSSQNLSPCHEQNLLPPPTGYPLGEDPNFSQHGPRVLPTVPSELVWVHPGNPKCPLT